MMTKHRTSAVRLVPNCNIPLSFAPFAVQRAVLSSILASILVCSSACQSTDYGGAPPPSFDVTKDLEQLAKQFDESNAIPDFYKSPSVEARNKFVTGRLTLMNIRYIQFIRKVTNDRQAVESATDILVLGLNLAGTAVGGATAKTILTAIAAGVTGSKAVVEKEYFYERTMPALIAEMNAQRTTALIPILHGLKTTALEDYPFEQTVSDLDNYYLAGTLLGAVQAIQADAGKKQSDNNEIIDQIRTSPPYSRSAEVMRARLTDAIGKLAPSDLSKVQAVLSQLSTTPPLFPALPTDIDSAKNQLQQKVRKAQTDAALDPISKDFTAAGISF